MATVNGTTSRRTSNYDFYFIWTLTKDNTNRRHVVNVKAYIKCISWDFDTVSADSWVHINIGGTVYNRPDGRINCNLYPEPHTYLLWEKTVYFAFSTAARSVYLRAYTDDLYVAGHGPGVCNAATTISIPAAYSTAGALAATFANECRVDLALTGLPTNVGFERTVKWYYKRGVDSVWVLAATQTISATNTSSSFTKIITGLLAGTGYSFKADIYDGTLLIATKSVGISTTAMAGTMIAKSMSSNSAFIYVIDLNSNTGYDRQYKAYKKKSSETAWALAKEGTVLATDLAMSVIYQSLVPATAYDFKIEFYTNGLYLGTKTLLAQSTLESTSAIPDVTLISAENVLVSTVIRVYWACYDIPVGSSFKVCHKPSGGALVVGSEITIPPTSGYTDIDVGAIASNTDYEITVRSYKTGASGYKETDPLDVTVYVDFDWDTAKVQGADFSMTEEEWNRMVAFVLAKNPPTNVQAWLQLVKAEAGRQIDNLAFNAIQDQLGITGNDQNDGDTISAAELNAIKTAINA